MNRPDDQFKNIDVAFQNEQDIIVKRKDQSITDYFQGLEAPNLQALNDKIQKTKLNFMQDYGLDLKSCMEMI